MLSSTAMFISATAALIGTVMMTMWRDKRIRYMDVLSEVLTSNSYMFR